MVTLEAQMHGHVQAANVHPQLQSIGGRHCKEIPIEQRLLDLPPLLRYPLPTLAHTRPELRPAISSCINAVCAGWVQMAQAHVHCQELSCKQFDIVQRALPIGYTPQIASTNLQGNACQQVLCNRQSRQRLGDIYVRGRGAGPDQLPRTQQAKLPGALSQVEDGAGLTVGL